MASANAAGTAEVEIQGKAGDDMNTRALAALSGLLVMLLAACTTPAATMTPAPTRTPLPTPRPLQTDTRTVERGGARSAQVELDILNGDLAVIGGAAALMEARFRYNILAWQPRVEYEVRAGEGWLSVRQGGDDAPMDDRVRNEWSVRLNNALPTALTVRGGNAHTHLQVQNLSLTRLNVEMTDGPVEVYLSRNHPDLVSVVVNTVGGNVEVDLSGNYRALTQVAFSTAGGALRVDLTGSFPALAEATFANPSGATTLDLTGDWSRDLDLTLMGGSGDARVIVSRWDNVRAEVTGAPAQVRADGFTAEEGGVYTRSPLNAPPDVTLNLHLRLDGGSVTLEARG